MNEIDSIFKPVSFSSATTKKKRRRPLGLREDFPRQEAALQLLSNLVADGSHDANDLMLFCEQDSRTGRRSFVAAEYAPYEDVYLSFATPSERHAYEIIRASDSCRLYFDVEVEFTSEEEKNVALESLAEKLTALLETTMDALRNRLGVGSVRLSDFTVLHCEYDAKYSKHIIFSRDDVLFENNRHVGAFVKFAILPFVPDAVDFVDDKVYTRNRAFRMLYSSKFGKQSVMEVDVGVHGHRADDSLESARAFLRKSLVAPCWLQHVVPTRVPGAYLIDARDVDKTLVTTFVSNAHIGNTRYGVVGGGASGEYESTVVQHLLLDAFVVDLASTSRGKATIRRVTYSEMDNRLKYEVGNVRYCQRIRREHKSNNVYYVVDVDQRTVVQRCYDPECRSWSSHPVELPRHVVLAEERTITR